MSDIYMQICPKCAWFKARIKCEFCNYQMLPTETSLSESMQLTDKQKEELINHYIETLIKDTYDPKAKEEREKNEIPVFANYIPDNRPKCPTCGSNNISKISTTKRLITTGLFGLASSDIGKTMKCNKCGYKW